MNKRIAAVGLVAPSLAGGTLAGFTLSVPSGAGANSSATATTTVSAPSRPASNTPVR